MKTSMRIKFIEKLNITLKVIQYLNLEHAHVIRLIFVDMSILSHENKIALNPSYQKEYS